MYTPTLTIANQTSGTTNSQSQILFVQDIIRRAYSKAGVSEGEQTPEMLTQAKQNLNLSLQNLLNKGLPLFSIKPYILGFNQGVIQYPLPLETYEIEDCVWRTTTPLVYTCTGGIDADALTAADYFFYATTEDSFTASFIDSGTPQYVNQIGIFFYGNQTVTLTFSYSTDGITYIDFDTLPTTSYKEGEWFWKQYEIGPTAWFLRVSIGEGERLAARAWYLSNLNTATDLPIARVSRNSYMNYPVKNQQGSPILYYFEKTLVPTVYVWGQPNSVYNWQLFMRLKVQLQDCGSLTNTLQVPPWYLSSIIAELACELCLEANSSEDMMKKYQILREDADRKIAQAAVANNDRAPISLIPNLSPYTR